MGKAPANLALFMKAGKATRFKKGQMSHNKGIPMSENQRIKISKTLKLHPRAVPNLEPVPAIGDGVILSHASINVRKWRAAAFQILGTRCTICGFNDIRALQIDHRNGGGNKERKTIFRSPRQFYKAVITDGGQKYQLLCANCNQIKRIEQREV